VTVVAVACAAGAVVQWRAADLQQRRATANSLAAQSRMFQGSDPGLSNLLALAAIDENRTQPAVDAALQALRPRPVRRHGADRPHEGGRCCG